MDGVPVFSAWRCGFAPGLARLLRFRGALNSTTSVVLSGMERGQSMQEALRTAQDAGIAEARLVFCTCRAACVRV
jgi:homoserine dehydrogenase